MPSVPPYTAAVRSPGPHGVAVQWRSGRQLSKSVVLLKIVSAGVCGTDLALITGARAGQAEVLGHEGVGVVAYTPEACGISRGTRVIINPVHDKSPGDVIGHSRDGIFSEWFWLEAADASDGGMLVPCPRDCPLENAELALTEPIASVLYSLELLKKNGARKLLLIRGSGTVAIVAAKLWMKLTGTAAIMASKSATHARWLQQAVEWPVGVSICHIEKLPELIRELGGGEPDAGILCCSREAAPEGLRCLLDSVKPGAAIDLMAGFPAEHREERLGDVPLDRIRWNNIRGRNSAPPTAVADRVSKKTVYLLGHRGTSQRHIVEAIDRLSRKVISGGDLPHRTVSIAELPDAIRQMVLRPSTPTNWVKTLVAFSNENIDELTQCQSR
jgi:threonine dehydrogenase-like Zn-dependent dehydrogenase